jgi:glucose uptake protein
MFIPSVYAAALFMMVLSMICWGSWANTQKLCKGWRFELFYWDYVGGILLISLLMGFTLGRLDPASPGSFILNLTAADGRHLLLAFVGGIVFNIANLLLVAATAIAGLAVAFPIGIGLALVIESILNYIITPKGNPVLLFGGIALVCVAIVLDALAYRKISRDLRVSTKGIMLSLLCGVGMGLFYPFVAKALTGENHLGPYQWHLSSRWACWYPLFH